MKWADVRGSAGSARPRLVLTVSVGPGKPRLVVGARALYQVLPPCSLQKNKKTVAVAKVSDVAAEGIRMGGLHDRSGLLSR